MQRLSNGTALGVWLVWLATGTLNPGSKLSRRELLSRVS
jgi:hypothetical protein